MNIVSNNSDDKRYELHARFFTEERMIVKDLDNAQLIERIQELDEIVLIAKARLNGAQAEERERKAKLRIEQKDYWPSTPDSSITDAIAPRKQQRQSKLDKLFADLQMLGISNADSLIKNVVNKQTQVISKQISNHEKDLKDAYKDSPHARLTIKPVRTETETDSTTEPESIEANPIANPVKPKLFDPKKLSFLKKGNG